MINDVIPISLSVSGTRGLASVLDSQSKRISIFDVEDDDEEEEEEDEDDDNEERKEDEDEEDNNEEEENEQNDSMDTGE